ncbi:MAG: Glucose-1-phosphate thymidylyltransferase [Microgenomates group bacterium GW2011_GWC1_43_11]|uniref:glucose-1-phosphate thymidylyltransferase n=2 Tax=Candidatus Gottesmaniibacteriota TaxID=1752720 RepID=A0A0G1IQB5_9BACT|nr:MAG: Glucose-1-phosphate thymidylyltransferase [Microgenomates group bacterium GW2011_GWC1_43_11]KKT39093.1 MAG: Glucose-1-phosphate thymidylyltransferase [Candidatus Gottesmanbacteria bacterium GW2011_GWB1_44_11c]KKT61566.1 MAG: Glucose-1-phosphate thymidylyltransferase [Candidatus Gottesmanbacteria bacterium GW2011_GWA1_44_24b]HCM82236.1 spore coat protein [Patescibacteria group bacterium]
MQGLILAGGLATRLRPLTLVTNKHLLPVYNKPMIYYSMEAMQKAGVKEVLLTTSGESVAQFANLLKSGEEFGLHLYYAVQQNPKGGIPDAMMLAEELTKNESLMVILGDNIFNFNLRKVVEEFETVKEGAVIFGYRVKDNQHQYGIVETDKDGRVLSIEEKPQHPKSDIAQTGIYIYDHNVFDYIRTLRPSPRGELEVTDLNNIYLQKKNLRCHVIDWWIDAGTSYDELLKANILAEKMVREGKL